MMRLKQVNLIPKEILRRSINKQLGRLFRKHKELRLAAVIAVLFISGNVAQVVAVSNFERKLNQSKSGMQEAKAKLNQIQSQYIALEKQKATITKEEMVKKQKLDLLMTTSSKEKKYAKLLAFIAGLTPQDLWINHFIVNEEGIKIAGSTFDNQLVTQFMDKLDESKIFKDSKFTSSEKQIIDSHPVYNFQITTEPIWDSLSGTVGGGQAKGGS